MNAVLLEPQDTLFFRDGIPMSAGQGRGAGCRLPLPNTWHEAVRTALLARSGARIEGRIPGRSRGSERHGKWQPSTSPADERFISSTAFQSLQTIGPLPFRREYGVLWPMPLDLVKDSNSRWHTLQLLDNPIQREGVSLQAIAVSPVGPEKQRPAGWWTTEQFAHYLAGNLQNLGEPIETKDLWQEEYRIGVTMDPARQAAEEGQLFSGTYLRPAKDTRFIAGIQLKNPRPGEAQTEAALDHIFLGGDRRMVRISRGALLQPPVRPDYAGEGPILLKWTLVTPAVFSHGWLPGWLKDTQGNRLPGDVCLKNLPARCRLVSVCLGRPEILNGWDIAANSPKPTQLAVPAGSVYYFLCENAAAANILADLLHWRPRSDQYGEKGYGYGLCGRATLFGTSPDVPAFAQSTFSK